MIIYDENGRIVERFNINVAWWGFLSASLGAAGTAAGYVAALPQACKDFTDPLASTRISCVFNAVAALFLSASAISAGIAAVGTSEDERSLSHYYAHTPISDILGERYRPYSELWYNELGRIAEYEEERRYHISYGLYDTGHSSHLLYHAIHTNGSTLSKVIMDSEKYESMLYKRQVL
ncbi:hypothetical protein V1506DRAFT_520996 [Lipomyces tetrasporus]